MKRTITNPASHCGQACAARSWRQPALLTVLSALVAANSSTAATVQSEFVSDHPEMIVASTQDWGVLGFDTAAHASDQAGTTLQIGEVSFEKGLGHHANGSITLLTDGQYDSFDAVVGIQPCSGGSVIFRVLVDGHERFVSEGLRSGDSGKAVHVPLTGAHEVRLEARDAGDGISCDMANWADARLTPIGDAASRRPVEPSVDVARFGRVVTWDPNRTVGARANRIEEFRADDLFTETELTSDRNGYYGVPVWTNGVGCIGLQWLNRRALCELALECAVGDSLPPANSVRVEGWFGESAWQGNWKPLTGEVVHDDGRLIFRFAHKSGMIQSQKIRWLLASAPRPSPVRLSAFTRSRWATTNLVAQLESSKAAGRGRLTVWNGEALDKSGSQIPNSEVSWNMKQALHLNVRYSRPSSIKSDPTVLQFRLPTGNVGVAVEDVLANDCVYLPDHGLFVAREPQPVTLAEYKQRITGRKTILAEVRSMPDQTLAQAMVKTHHEAQREGPVLLSLACDNTKFVLERDGVIRCVGTTNPASSDSETRLEVKPQFGDGKSQFLSRTLDGGWLPIPVITYAQDGVAYQQRSFVAPCDEAGGNPARFSRQSVGVFEFTLTNTQPAAAKAAMALSFGDQRKGSGTLKLTPAPRGWLVSNNHGALALAATTTVAPLAVTAKADVLEVAGALPPHSAAQVVLFLPTQTDTALDSVDAARLRAATETYWNGALAPAMQIATPDPLLNDVIRSSQVRCLIDARSEAAGARVAAWIAAMSYGPLESESHSVIRGMDFMGHDEFARRSLDFFVHRYNTNGFLTTGYTTFGTAWHLWTLGEHYRLTHDREWLRQIAPEIARVGHWIVRQTENTKRHDMRGQPAPESGLMPPGVLADWNAFAYHFTMNAYYTAALRELGDALGDIGHPDAAFFKRQAEELRAATLRAYAWTQGQSPALALRDGTWIPHYPSQVHSPGKLGDFFPGQDGGRSWCYDVEIGAHQLVPAGVLGPHCRELERMMDHMEDVQFLADGLYDYPATMNHSDWFNLGGFSKVQPYYTRNCEIYALRDDVKPFVRSYFNSIATLLNPEVLTFWEHFRHSGAWDKTHETGYFLHQTRTMLVQERGAELWLAPFVTDQWLKDGERMVVKHAPTRFGKVSYEINSHLAQGFVEARIEPPSGKGLRQVVLRLRHPGGGRIQSVSVNGKHHRRFEPDRETITLNAGPSTLTVRVSFQPQAHD